MLISEETYVEFLLTWTEWDTQRPLIKALYDIEYAQGHELDENRIEDAFDLRHDLGGEQSWVYNNPISLLEVMIALCDRLTWQVDAEVGPVDIFTVMLNNANLPQAFCDQDLEEFEKTLRAIMTNDFPEDGEGSFFPIGHRHISKTAFRPVNELDLWTQASQYLYLEGF